MNNACDQELIELFHDGDCDPTATAALQSHLGGCASCREYLTWLRGLEPLLEQVRDSASQLPGTDSRWRALLAKRSRRDRRSFYWGGALAAAGIAVVLVARSIGGPTAPALVGSTGAEDVVSTMLQEVTAQTVSLETGANGTDLPATLAAVDHARRVREGLLEDQAAIAALQQELMQ